MHTCKMSAKETVQYSTGNEDNNFSREIVVVIRKASNQRGYERVKLDKTRKKECWPATVIAWPLYRLTRRWARTAVGAPQSQGITVHDHWCCSHSATTRQIVLQTYMHNVQGILTARLNDVCTAHRKIVDYTCAGRHAHVHTHTNYRL